MNSRRPKQLRARRLFAQRLEDRRLLAAGSDDLAELSDEFDDTATTSAWTRIHEHEGWNADQLQIYDIDQTQGGSLVMQPETVTWYRDWRGPYSFKEVTGDFVFTTEVTVGDRDDIGDSDPDDIPDGAQYSLGGAMIRTPRAISSGASDWTAGGENYVFLSLGHGTDGNLAHEVKTTVDSNSDLQLSPASSQVATLQIARIGNSVILLRRAPGEEWVVHERYSRPDMPDTLQVGMVSYSDWGKAGDFTPLFHNSHVLEAGVSPDPSPAEAFNPDLVAAYDYARFARPEVPATLDGVDLVNSATDQELLSFLGSTPNQPAAEPEDDVIEFRVQISDAAGQNVSALTVGDSFFAEFTVDDLRGNGTGVFSAFTDVAFDSSLASVQGEVLFGSEFPNAQEAILSSPGLIDELGAISDETPSDGLPQLLARVPMVATSDGTFMISTDPADLLPDHELGLYGFDNPVASSRVIFGSASVTIHAAVENVPPVASPDSAEMFHDDDPILVAVLGNDTTEAGETLQIVSQGSNVGGDFEIVGSEIRFQPDDGFVGTASTQYTIDDGNGGQDVGLLEIDVIRRWHLASTPHDTNNDGDVSPLDALRIINVMSRYGVVEIPNAPAEQLAAIEFYADVNNDNRISALDALAVINELGRQALARQVETEAFSFDLDDELVASLAADQAGLF